MAELDYELGSVIVDLSTEPLKKLSSLDDAAIADMLRTAGEPGEMSARQWNNDPLRHELSSGTRGG